MCVPFLLQPSASRLVSSVALQRFVYVATTLHIILCITLLSKQIKSWNSSFPKGQNQLSLLLPPYSDSVQNIFSFQSDPHLKCASLSLDGDTLSSEKPEAFCHHRAMDGTSAWSFSLDYLGTDELQVSFRLSTWWFISVQDLKLIVLLKSWEFPGDSAG